METFPHEFVTHNLPFILVSGLTTRSSADHDSRDKGGEYLHDGGFRLRSDAPVVQGITADRLYQAFLEHDGSHIPWNGHAVTTRDGNIFKIRTVGRTFTLPPRKAPPPPHSPRRSSIKSSTSPPPPLVLHSTLSPLTPSSPLYPDGILTPLWIAKHQNRLPAVFIAAFTLTADPNASSLEDNRIKGEISNLRSVLSSTNYKTKLVVILVGSDLIETAEAEERLQTIRKSNVLDNKTLQYLPADASVADTAEFTKNLLAWLQPQCIEYYRDLSKHARRKRNRNTIPQPTVNPGTSAVLSSMGWNLRYEFKLGVFAEFRQEMDAAARNYESAYETLFSPEMFDTIPAWSNRFNEGRTIADAVAIRIIRCHLWTEHGNAAVDVWANHRNRVRDLVERRGKGTTNYGWEAWQSVWSKTMAELVDRSQYPKLNVPFPDGTDVMSVVAYTDPLSSTERMQPFSQLHHSGYWYRLTAEHADARRELASQIADNDRQPPKSTSTSVTTNNNRPYDCYVAEEPHNEMPADGLDGYDHSKDIQFTLETAIKHFAARGQLRMMEQVSLACAAECMKAQSWTKAFDILHKLWKNQIWRRAGWMDLLQTVGQAFLECAAQLQNAEMIIKVTWELYSSLYAKPAKGEFDIDKSIDQIAAENLPVAVAIDAQTNVSTITASLAFGFPEGSVGDSLQCQLCLRSLARPNTPPVDISEIKIVFEGGLTPVFFVASEGNTDSLNDDALIHVSSIEMGDSTKVITKKKNRLSTSGIPSLSGTADLMLRAGHTRVLRFHVTPREAGDVSVSSINLLVEHDKYSLTDTILDFDDPPSEWWEFSKGVPVSRSFGMDRNVTKVKILPKPPRIQVRLPVLEKVYYTNEGIELELQIVNEEEDAARGRIEVQLITPAVIKPTLRWHDQPDTVAETIDGIPASIKLPSRPLESLPTQSTKTMTILISETAAAVDHELEIAVLYSLESDPETQLTRVLTVDLPVVRPFEANYDFSSQYDPEPWPNFFDSTALAGGTTSPQGSKQVFAVTSRICSFAMEPLEIAGVLVTAQKIVGQATCSSTTGLLIQHKKSGNVEVTDKIAVDIAPEQTRSFISNLTLQKTILGDRHGVSLDLALEIGWRRPGSSKIQTSILETPRFSAPMAEPRVLLTVPDPPNDDNINTTGMRCVQYWVENPSMHFLTFNVTMESSEEFAFSGPKTRAISLAPLSRDDVVYLLLPYKRSEWIKVNLKVVDAYFGQTLRILPTGSKVKLDKLGNVLVWIE